MLTRCLLITGLLMALPLQVAAHAAGCGGAVTEPVALQEQIQPQHEHQQPSARHQHASVSGSLLPAIALSADDQDDHCDPTCMAACALVGVSDAASPAILVSLPPLYTTTPVPALLMPLPENLLRPPTPVLA